MRGKIMSYSDEGKNNYISEIIFDYEEYYLLGYNTM
jgi:hypothetical protein